MESVAWVLGVGFTALLTFLFPKKVGIAVGILALIGLSIAGYFWVADFFAKQRLAKIGTVALFDLKKCSDADYPIFVVFTNKSTSKVLKIYFSLKGYNPRHSEPVSSQSYLSSDRIIDPGKSYATCWRYREGWQSPVDLIGTEWRVTLHSAEFQ